MINKLQNQAFISKQKSVLLAEKARVEEELKSINKFPQYGDTEESNAQEVERFEGYKGLESGIKGLLKELNNALINLEKGQYGVCQICHNPIDLKRLQAFPAAQTCVACSGKKK